MSALSWDSAPARKGETLQCLWPPTPLTPLHQDSSF